MKNILFLYNFTKSDFQWSVMILRASYHKGQTEQQWIIKEAEYYPKNYSKSWET